MSLRYLLASLVLVSTGCTSLDRYDALRSEHLSIVRDEDDDGEKFKALLQGVGKDSVLLYKKGREWNTGEGAFGLAVLAAAAYGAFNTVYDGNNLKDAAFAAAALGSLRSFANPGERRDAYLKAATGLSCLHEKASPFADPPTFKRTRSTSTVDVGDLSSMADLLSAQASPIVNLFLEALDEQPEPESMFAPDKHYTGVQAQAIATAQLAQQRLADQYKSAGFSFLSAVLTEEEIYAERFVLVSSTYLAILGKLFDSTKFSAPAYEKSLEDLKSAAKTAAESEANAKQVAAVVSASGPAAHVVAVSALEEQLKKYAKAKVEVLACRPAA